MSTGFTFKPVSSSASRIAASAKDSPGSICPPGKVHLLFHLGDCVSRILPSLSSIIAEDTASSPLGNLLFISDIFLLNGICGGGRIRTYEELTPLIVFKTISLNRSDTPPYRLLQVCGEGGIRTHDTLAGIAR